MPAERTVPVGMRVRPSARRTTVAMDSQPRAVRRTNPKPTKPRMNDAQRHAMQDLFSLEARRRQELGEQDRLAHEIRTQKSLDIDQSIRAERLKSQENRAPEPSWRGYNDYEVEVFRAEQEQIQRVLRAEIVQQREQIRLLRSAADEHNLAHETMVQANRTLTAQIASLQEQLATYDAKTHTLHAEVQATRTRNAQLETQLSEAESLRRKLHNQVQELRGNVRVYVRVRPARNDGELASITYPDPMLHSQIELLSQAENAMGQPTVRQHAFGFDHVFPPQATQEDVFAEVSDLMQSVLDGYNTTIFAYGQTGSGKTHTLEGGANTVSHKIDTSAGLIPRAMHMLWDVAHRLKTQGWTYEFHAQMLQIYLDQVSDLLASSDSSSREKHEIRHTENHTNVTNTVVVPLSSAEEVFELLERAKKRRQVAATLMNDRSSRSHSVFILRVRGTNSVTNEVCDATLNLVDLAGSERLATSGSASDPSRLKEAQSINKSLSSLGDVIGALSSNHGTRHIPYRNSTLTWLLKNSLGGNSKTLMLLALSPLKAHMNESLCSLRFASKVHATHIGSARAIKSSTEA
ncbi:kinesin-like nuclear fusion protein [Malassezia psittaci]|uniref:Kinesin-like protein n=1 Tax=Malassezia psittaci TaxID=1821823 RepID=A0AAF0JMH1_9BASI|nr:kinesin-like nuclear fusion protein [Malassezia psittaci]